MTHLSRRMNPRPLLFLLLAATAHAGVEVDIEKFGESLGGWTKEGKKAAEYKFSETDYRTYKPEVTQAPDGGVFISVRVDHLRGLFSADDHASIEMSFGPTARFSPPRPRFPSRSAASAATCFAAGGQSAAKAAGDLVGGTAEKAAKLSSNVFASLASKVLRENVTEPGRIAYPAALRHNYNLLYQCVKFTKDPPKALPVEGEEAPKKPVTAEVKTAPEGMLDVRTFGETPKEEPKKEAEAAKP
jgi:hypothetical protein